MLTIAVPNKGSLAGDAADMLREAGYRQRTDARELVLRDPANDTEFFFLRPRDIATYVGSGRLDVGITGRDLLLDSGAKADEVLPLGFGGSTFRFAAATGTVGDVAALSGRRVATSYPGLVAAHLQQLGVDAEVIRLDGAVETAVRLGVADAIADPVVEQLVRRLQGVQVARTYVLMDYDVRTELVDAAVAVTPGIESPTVSPLHREGWVAVRAMVPRAQTNRVMDALWEIGARGILVTDIHACRL